jgi:hypothetical protein
MSFSEKIKTCYQVVASTKWKERLTFNELVDFMDQWMPITEENEEGGGLDPDEVEGMLGRCTAVLKEVPIDSLKGGFADANLRDEKREKEYSALPLGEMPPIVVQDGVIVDGNHRWRVAKAKKAKTILIYDCQ